MKILCLLVYICLFFHESFQYPEQGNWVFTLEGHSGSGFRDKVIVITKSQYAGSEYTIEVLCKPLLGSEIQIRYSWYLRKAACWKEYYESEEIDANINSIFKTLEEEGRRIAPNYTSLFMTSNQVHPCDGKNYFLTSADQFMKTANDFGAEKFQAAARPVVSDPKSDDVGPMKREAGGRNATDTRKRAGSGADRSEVLFFAVPYDGVYQLLLGTSLATPVSRDPAAAANTSYDIALAVKIKNKSGYISAADSPLRIFYCVMCVVYALYAVAWLVVCSLRWRELLRVQYWIGAVIFLGLVEKAVFLSEYDAINKTGSSVSGLILFAELVSCAKRTLSRLLVIIVSYGFGIVKPRLGVVLNRIVIVGFVYFVLASFEGCYRVLMPKSADEDYAQKLMFAIVPLAVMESGICWWVFTALWSTMRTLQLRKNTVKLNLFRHFTHVLVFAVVSSIVFMTWSLRHLNYDVCLSDWKQLWVNDAFWHVLFAIILATIMVLWRPTNNNQRFAFSPLLDDGSDEESEEEQEMLMADVSDTMKFRSSGKGASGSSQGAAATAGSRAFEDELKWAEENIPSAATDTGIPALDSDEEVILAKFEMSKMQ